VEPSKVKAGLELKTNTPRRTVVVAWSGGIDSTALVGCLLKAGHAVVAVAMPMYRGFAMRMERRESRAREDVSNGLLEKWKTEASWSKTLPLLLDLDDDWHAVVGGFATPDGEIPTRNRRLIDRLVAKHLPAHDSMDLGLGEYVGCDTWLVRDHVGAVDCDARSLTAYLFNQYGMGYRLWTLADFGESRYKADRLLLGIRSLGLDVMTSTTNCLNDVEVHCGDCYKCEERRAAFDVLGIGDPTEYAREPDAVRVAQYRRQMRGDDLERETGGDVFAEPEVAS